MDAILLVFLVVLVLNVIPAFAPPTWMVFSFLGFRFPEHAGCWLSLVRWQRRSGAASWPKCPA
jgi:hypothetical protein